MIPGATAPLHEASDPIIPEPLPWGHASSAKPKRKVTTVYADRRGQGRGGGSIINEAQTAMGVEVHQNHVLKGLRGKNWGGGSIEPSGSTPPPPPKAQLTGPPKSYGD